jgi:hypothetical protein
LLHQARGPRVIENFIYNFAAGPTEVISLYSSLSAIVSIDSQ